MNEGRKEGRKERTKERTNELAWSAGGKITDFYVHVTVHRNSVSIEVQRDATIHSLLYL